MRNIPLHEKAINAEVPRSDSLLSRMFSKLGNLASGAAHGVPAVRDVGRGTLGRSTIRPAVAESASFLEADRPARTALDDTLDELDARFDAAAPPSPEDIVTTLVPQSSRPADPNLN